MNVYVPVAGRPSVAGILPRSGIVGAPKHGQDRVLIDFEGNRFGASNVVTFADRVYHAWSRATTDYPTVARLYVPICDVIAVGTFDGERVTLAYSHAHDVALADWLGFPVDNFPRHELERS